MLKECDAFNQKRQTIYEQMKLVEVTSIQQRTCTGNKIMIISVINKWEITQCMNQLPERRNINDIGVKMKLSKQRFENYANTFKNHRNFKNLFRLGMAVCHLDPSHQKINSEPKSFDLQMF